MKKIRITHTVYEYSELSKDIQQRVFNDWLMPYASVLFNKKSKGETALSSTNKPISQFLKSI